METVLAFAAIFGAAYFVTIICAAFVTALKISPAPAVAINSSKMVKIKYRRDHWILIAFTLEDTNWNLRTQVVYLVMNWKFSLQQKQKHQKNCATCWSVTSLMRVFYRSKRKNQFNCLLVLGNNHHLLPLLQLWHPSHSGWCGRRYWPRFRLRKLLSSNQREGNSWSWRSSWDWGGLSFSFLDKNFQRPLPITTSRFVGWNTPLPLPFAIRKPVKSRFTCFHTLQSRWFFVSGC